VGRAQHPGHRLIPPAVIPALGTGAQVKSALRVVGLADVAGLSVRYGGVSAVHKVSLEVVYLEARYRGGMHLPRCH
jgi:hypothetical protein